MEKGPVDVQGLAELVRDFRLISKDLDKKMTKTLKEAAAPAAAEGERLVLGGISNMPLSPRWAGMRVGIARRHGQVYMVPKARRRGGASSGRQNLSGLMGPLMELAVQNKAADIEDALGDLLDNIADSHGFD